MTIGQVILGVRDLDASTREFEALGLRVVDGGNHPGLGTANRVIPLGTTYLELLGVSTATRPLRLTSVDRFWSGPRMVIVWSAGRFALSRSIELARDLDWFPSRVSGSVPMVRC